MDQVCDASLNDGTITEPICMGQSEVRTAINAKLDEVQLGLLCRQMQVSKLQCAEWHGLTYRLCITHVVGWIICRPGCNFWAEADPERTGESSGPVSPKHSALGICSPAGKGARQAELWHLSVSATS